MNFFSIILFFSFFASAQTYHFDYSLESKRLADGNFKEWNWGKIFFDTKNNTNMSFFDDGTLKAILFDVPRNMTHVFNVEESKNNTKFKYSHSNKYLSDNSSDESPYSIDIEKIDDANFKIDVYVYTNNKKTKKKKKVSAIATLEKADFEYFVIHADFFPSDYIKNQILEKMPEDSKYYIKKVTVEYVGSKKFTLINEVQTSDITLPVPIQKEKQ
ncbi:hypothetical protein [Chryseobacterium foetidum]|uniref:hypothetical protein n=1 Tax=Chryseobacterium foetidum TaxID=2951057 RepID=UPI0021CAB0EB|nr:hypothetical protein [Chryseobacterium foetidum]